jgi:uncharacterized RmlC-like cupin family protein
VATVIKLEDIEASGKYEPGLRHRFGLTDATCDAKNICMLRASIPPGNRIRAHFHLKAETCIYILSGRAQVIMGAPGMQDEVYEVGPNTFVYMDEGEIHNFINLSQEETVELVASYSAPNGEATRKVYIEPPVDQTPT